MSRFTPVLLAIVAGLALTIGILSAASARLGPRVDSMATARDLDGASVRTAIALTFTEPMNPASVERAFRIQPAVRGDFNWSGNEMFFTPRVQLAFNHRYTVTVDKRALGASGKTMFRMFRADFTTQTQHLIYLGTQGRDNHRLVLASVDGASRIIGPDDGSVAEYSVSPDRSMLVYSRHASPGSRTNQLWLLNLSDDSTHLLYSHPDWSISQPHISPDDRDVVFLATNVIICQYYGCIRDKTGPIIYLFDRQTSRVRQFQPRGSAPLTYFIDFSPSGQVAYTDLGSALTLAPIGNGIPIHVPNLGNSLEYAGFDAAGDKAAFVGQTPSSSGGDILVYDNHRGSYIDVSRGIYDSSTPGFSASGREIAYAAYHTEQGIEPVYGINVYNFASRVTRRLTSERQWSDWNPVWSLNDRYIAFVRSQPQETMYMGAGEIWVVRSNGEAAHPLGGTGKDVQWLS